MAINLSKLALRRSFAPIPRLISTAPDRYHFSVCSIDEAPSLGSSTRTGYFSTLPFYVNEIIVVNLFVEMPLRAETLLK